MAFFISQKLATLNGVKYQDPLRVKDVQNDIVYVDSKDNHESVTAWAGKLNDYDQTAIPKKCRGHRLPSASSST